MEGLNLLSQWAQANVEQIIFYLLAIVAIPLAYGVIFDRNIIRSGFLLIGVFATIAGLFLLLQAQFLAMVQILLYGVAITLVVVIALMLTNPRLEREASTSLPSQRAPAAVVSVLVFLCIYLSLRPRVGWPVSTSLPPDPAQNARDLGIYLMTQYSLPFEFASILLLAALIGAIMLAKSDAPAAARQVGEEKPVSSERTDDVVKV